MKIRYAASHPTKAGLTEHINNLVGQTLIALGQAEAVPLPARGSAGWLEERQAQAALAGRPDIQDVDPNAMQKAIEACAKGERPHPFAAMNS